MPVQVVLSFAQSLIAPVLTATLLSMLAYDPDFRLRRDQARYCASLTCSSQSTTLPSSASAIAMCVIAVVGAAPCQCFSPGANQTTSPGRICSTGPPSRCARPQPAVTIRVCPSGCVCHAVRAPGSNVTLEPLTRAGSGALNSGSMRTVPVNHSPGPLPEGCVPFRLISMVLVLRRLIAHTI